MRGPSDYSDCQWPIWKPCRDHDDAQITALDGYAYIIQAVYDGSLKPNGRALIKLHRRYVPDNLNYTVLLSRLAEPDQIASTIQELKDNFMTYHVSTAL